MFAATPETLREVRRFVRDTLRGWDRTRSVEAAQLIASELATNAVKHAHSPYSVSVSRADSMIRIEVHDTSFTHPAPAAHNVANLGGRGVRLVAALSNAWGTREEPDGKTVWAELRD